MKNIFIECRGVVKVAVIENDIDFSELMQFLESLPAYTENILELKVSLDVFIDKTLFENYKKEFKTEYWPVFGGVTVLVIDDDMYFEPVEKRFYKIEIESKENFNDADYILCTCFRKV